MSVWRVATAEPVTPGMKRGPARRSWFVDGVVKWIPSELVLLYAAVVTIYGARSARLLLTVILLAPIIVLVVRFRRQRKFTRDALAAAVTVAVSTAVWTLVIPGAGWSSISFVGRNGPVVAAAALVAGLAIAAVASIVESRVVDLDAGDPDTVESPTNAAP